jgi:OFA family oxalate/formate antiporter-like MFS transporter
VAALMVPLGSVVRALTGDWTAVLYLAAGVNLLTAVLALLVLMPMRRRFIRRSMQLRASEKLAELDARAA